MTRAFRLSGWVFISAGALILLYLVYSLLFTNIETQRAQAALLDQWELTVEAPADDRAVPASGAADPVLVTDDRLSDQAAQPVDIGDALAKLEFSRPGSAEPIVRDDPLFIVEGVTIPALKAGPGHYPETAMPGEDGNFAVAGHRTTYGAPFFNLDELQPGDDIWVTDRSGTRFQYRVAEQRIVAPTAVEVIGPDPLGVGGSWLTLTTCNPRFSARERLIIFAELVI